MTGGIGFTKLSESITKYNRSIRKSLKPSEKKREYRKNHTDLEFKTLSKQELIDFQQTLRKKKRIENLKTLL
jgi:hypothetical protein